LDAAAERNGRSRNAEAVARLERSLLAESPYPEGRALVTFVSELTMRAGGIVDLLDPEFRGGELAMLKGAFCGFLNGLGANSDANVMALGETVGRRLISDALLAMAKAPAQRSAAEETLAEAALAWRLTPDDQSAGKRT
jgi:hypothetical protein